MTAEQLFTKLIESGFTVRCESDKLQVSPAKYIDQKLLNSLKIHKGELVELLKTQQVISHWWLLHYAVAESELVCTWPPSTHINILNDNPAAIAAEPIAGFVENYYEKVQSDPSMFYEHSIKGCFEFKVEQDRLVVTPAHWIDEQMYSLIQIHSEALIMIVIKNSA